MAYHPPRIPPTAAQNQPIQFNDILASSRLPGMLSNVNTRTMLLYANKARCWNSTEEAVGEILKPLSIDLVRGAKASAITTSMEVPVVTRYYAAKESVAAKPYRFRQRTSFTRGLCRGRNQ
ncbi:hypothetical protein Salat_1540800 [Sesamum alatum]|uniref:Uncharacterized protein n=1 Tax=Sesamum alatum TaxID=300844 RepID=A0AAE1YCQ8_9LAMI|nr:hypothetical protein Salat_1540800 [Sesamum alatum]